MSRLYATDETGWLEATATLVDQGRYEQVDHQHLAEFLRDMAARDRREVLSRLEVLLTHLLKWEYQPKQRCRSWLASMIEQQHRLTDLVASGSLKRHAEESFEKAFARAAAAAAAQTGMPQQTFPEACPFSLDEALQFKADDEDLTEQGA